MHESQSLSSSRSGRWEDCSPSHASQLSRACVKSAFKVFIEFSLPGRVNPFGQNPDDGAVFKVTFDINLGGVVRMHGKRIDFHNWLMLVEKHGISLQLCVNYNTI